MSLATLVVNTERSLTAGRTTNTQPFVCYGLLLVGVLGLITKKTSGMRLFCLSCPDCAKLALPVFTISAEQKAEADSLREAKLAVLEDIKFRTANKLNTKISWANGFARYDPAMIVYCWTIELIQQLWTEKLKASEK